MCRRFCVFFTWRTNHLQKLASTVLVFLCFYGFFCHFVLFFSWFFEDRRFFHDAFFFFKCCISCATAPSGASQVDIADICWCGGLVQLVQAFPTGTSVSLLLLLLLLLPPFTQAALQNALDLLLALLQNVLPRKIKEKVTHPNRQQSDGCSHK